VQCKWKKWKNFQNDVSYCFITIFLSKLKSSNVTPLEIKKVASKSLFYNNFFNVFFIFLILFDLFEIVNQNWFILAYQSNHYQSCVNLFWLILLSVQYQSFLIDKLDYFVLDTETHLERTQTARTHVDVWIWIKRDGGAFLCQETAFMCTNQKSICVFVFLHVVLFWKYIIFISRRFCFVFMCYSRAPTRK